jgi:hypothetical protein
MTNAGVRGRPIAPLVLSAATRRSRLYVANFRFA